MRDSPKEFESNLKKHSKKQIHRFKNTGAGARAGSRCRFVPTPACFCWFEIGVSASRASKLTEAFSVTSQSAVSVPLTSQNPWKIAYFRRKSAKLPNGTPLENV